MPKLSRESAQHVEQQPGVFEERKDEIGAYTASFVTLEVDMDLAPLFKGLPDDRCQCTHWGYMFKGTQTITYADHEETYRAGDAFVITPGHTPRASAGSEFVVFSPTEQFREIEAVMARNAQAMQTA
jgi:hypothetical protein